MRHRNQKVASFVAKQIEARIPAEQVADLVKQQFPGREITPAAVRRIAMAQQVELFYHNDQLESAPRARTRVSKKRLARLGIE